MSLELDIGVITATSITDGFVTAQLDMNGTDANCSSDLEVHYPYGLYGRPLDPVVDPLTNIDYNAAGQALLAFEGSTIHVWPQEDIRMIPAIPTPEKGGSIQYGGQPSSVGYASFDGKTGAYTLKVPPTATITIECGTTNVTISPTGVSINNGAVSDAVTLKNGVGATLDAITAALVVLGTAIDGKVDKPVPGPPLVAPLMSVVATTVDGIVASPIFGSEISG